MKKSRAERKSRFRALARKAKSFFRRTGSFILKILPTVISAAKSTRQ